MTLATQQAEVHPHDSTIPIVLSPGGAAIHTRGIPTDMDRLEGNDRVRARATTIAITVPTGVLPAEPVDSAGLRVMAHGVEYMVYQRHDAPAPLHPGSASSILIIVPVSEI